VVAKEDLVLVIKEGVIRLHLATRVIGLFLLNVADGVEIAVITAVG
jgi:hypothetical protein